MSSLVVLPSKEVCSCSTLDVNITKFCSNNSYAFFGNPGQSLMRRGEASLVLSLSLLLLLLLVLLVVVLLLEGCKDIPLAFRDLPAEVPDLSSSRFTSSLNTQLLSVCTKYLAELAVSPSNLRWAALSR